MLKELSGASRFVRRSLRVAALALRSYLDREHPNFASLILTRRCNLRCRFCNAPRVAGEREMDTDTAIRCIDRVHELGVPRFNLSGGEPLLRPDVYRLLRHAGERFSLGINSNGALPEKQYALLLDTPVDYVGISLHALSPALHDAMTGVEGTWRRAVSTLTFLRRHAGARTVSAVCTVTADNVDEVLPLRDFLRAELDVGLRITPVSTVATPGAGLDAIKRPDLSLVRFDERLEALEAEVLADGGRSVLRSPTYLRLAFAQARGVKSWHCQAGRLYFSISPEGKFGICQDFDTRLDFLADGFLDELRSAPFRREMARMRARCGGCTYPCYLQTQIGFDRWAESLLHLLRYQAQRLGRR